MRKVFCRKYKQELPGLAAAPFPGEKGLDIFNNVSQQAWDDWNKYQTMLINERALNMASKEDRKFVSEQMQLFFDNKEVSKIEGLR